MSKEINKASAAFSVAKAALRAGKLSDADFDKASALHKAAAIAFDEAHAKNSRKCGVTGNL